MNNVFKKFSQEIKFDITPTFSQVQISQAKLVSESVFELTFESREIVPFMEMQQFLVALNKNFVYRAKFNFNVTAVVYEPFNVKQYLEWVLNDYLKKPTLAKVAGGSSTKVSNEGKITFEASTASVKRSFEMNLADIQRVMQKFGFNNISFEVHLNETHNPLEEEKNSLLNQAEEAMKQASTPVVQKEFVKKNRGPAKVAISDLASANETRVVIDGELFQIDEMKTKTGLTIFTLSVTDYKEAIYVKSFARTDEEVFEMRKFKVGEIISITGNYQIDSFSKEPTILASTVKSIGEKKKARMDTAPEKRVELGARTRMSTMDGVVTAEEIVRRAEAWGHRAIAIVDTDSVQAFPEFYNATKKSTVKPIYGVTVNVISKFNDSVYNPQDKALESDNYVVFDLETTGLSPIFNDIIEFGAVKVVGGEVVDKKQFFIKPTHDIPEFITELTGISNDMVRNAKPEKEAIEDIRAYLDGHTLVAHNARFDINFVNEKLAKYGHEQLTVPVIDSMIVSRMVQPDLKRYRLEAVATKYNVSYDSTVAHRADYDADVLARVWVKLIDGLKAMNLNTQIELANYQDPKLYEKAYSQEVTLLAKNQEGLKEMFRIVSISLTENLQRTGIVFAEDLVGQKNILVGSGALRSKLVDLMLTGSTKQIKDEITKYDFIQLQPLINFTHKFKDISKEQIQEVMRMVTNEARRQGKIVVASGDVRYIDPEQKIYHEVYINAKGLGGSRHYLFRYNDNNPTYPDQYMLTTDEMIQEFSFLGEASLVKDVVIRNTNLIADMCDKLQVIKDKLYTPSAGNADEMLEQTVYKNAYAKYGNPLPEIVEARIRREIEPIKKYGFAIIYWIAHLLVGKSLRDGYLVGSRGSVGSSFVATMAEITEVNPLDPHYVCEECKHSEFFPGSPLNSGYDLPDKMCPNCNKPLRKEGQKIPFETFLGFEANKVPDIDLNFSGDYQPTIHNEVKVIFGESHAFRAGTISTVAEKTAYGYVKAWAEDTGRELSRPFTEYIAKGVTGTKRTTGQHPGGIIVIPQEFDAEDFSPINYPANDKNSAWKTTHFDFHAIHDNVLKLDLLGHDDPTAIRYLEKLTGINVKRDIPFSDPNIIELFSSTKPLGIKPEDIDGEPTGAMGIPEFGTTFVRRMLKTAKVTSFGDLISVSGLSHGTDVWTGNAEVVVKQLGKQLNEVISCRDNIMTDLMEKGLPPLLSFEIMEKVRKGKGITDEWEKQMKEKGVEDWYIDSLKKIQYMFPKAHATAYVMMAWRIAWFKLYRPEAYYATYFTTRADVFDIDSVVKGRNATFEKLKEFKARKGQRGEAALSNKEEDLIPILELAVEAFARGIKISNISLEKSEAKNWIIDEKTKELIPPFVAIDGLGEAVAESIVQARKEKPFLSLEDLQRRTSLNKTSIEKLKVLGVLKHLSESNAISLFDDLF